MSDARIPWGAPAGDGVPSSVAGGTADPGDIFGAAVRSAWLTDMTSSATVALEEAYGNRSRAIKAATGEDLGNPMTLQEASGFAQLLPLSGVTTSTLLTAASIQARAAYQNKLAELAKTADPDTRDIIGADWPLTDDAIALARQSDQQLGELMAANPGWQGQAANFAGGMAGTLRDPMVLGSLALGGGPGAARTFIGRLLGTAAREALVNGATTAAMQPAVQEWRREAGLPNGFDQAATNVLLAAVTGGVIGTGAAGLHELAGVLTRARPALAEAARGALDAQTLQTATDAVRPDGVSQATHDRRVMYADVAAQTRELPPLAPDRPDEVSVNKIVNALAPSPESIASDLEPRTDASIAALTGTLDNPAKASLAAPTPVLDHIRALGGVDPKSPVADELRAAGVTAKSVYRKGGLKALDNLPHDELPDAVRHSIADDGNGYASEDALVQAAGAEAQGFGAGQTPDDVQAIRDHYERQGVDFAAPAAEVRDQVRAVDAAEARYGAADNARSGQGQPRSDEVTHVPEGLTRRQHTDQLVRQALALQPGLPAEHVKAAVNLSLFEDVPIEEAVSDVMADAAGVPRPGDSALEPVKATLELDRAYLMKHVSIDRKADGGFFNTRAQRAMETEAGHIGDLVVTRDFSNLVVREPGREPIVAVLKTAKGRDGLRRIEHVVVTPDLQRKGIGSALIRMARDQIGVALDNSADGEFSAAGAALFNKVRTLGIGDDAIDELAHLPSEPPALPAEAPIDGEAAAGAAAAGGNFAAEKAALEELGFGGDIKLPIGDGLMSIADLEQSIKDSAWLERVVEACKL